MRIDIKEFYEKPISSLRIFKVEAEPKILPVDFDIRRIVELLGWEPTKSNFRIWYKSKDLEEKLKGSKLKELMQTSPRLIFSHLDSDKGNFVNCVFYTNGKLVMYGNDEHYCLYVMSTFLKEYRSIEESWRLNSKWTAKGKEIAYFLGSLMSCLGDVEVKWPKRSLLYYEKARKYLDEGKYKHSFNNSLKCVNCIIEELANKVPKSDSISAKLSMIGIPLFIRKPIETVSQVKNTLGQGKTKEFEIHHSLIAMGAAEWLIDWFAEIRGRWPTKYYTLEISLDQKKSKAQTSK